MRDHPMIEQIERTGFPLDIIEQPEHVGFDFYKDEILVGDDVVEYDGDIILQDNLERYLAEELGFEFKTL